MDMSMIVITITAINNDCSLEVEGAWLVSEGGALEVEGVWLMFEGVDDAEESIMDVGVIVVGETDGMLVDGSKVGESV